jgi:hypothetical protein
MFFDAPMPCSTAPQTCFFQRACTLARRLALALGICLGSPAVMAMDAGEAAPLQFSEFFKMPLGPAGLEISDTLRKANGRMVRMTGYMVQQETPHPGHFILTPRPVQMSEHADGDADDLPAAWLMVDLPAEQLNALVPHVRGLIEVSGRLSVGRFEAEDGRVSWVRLQLQPGATRAMRPEEWHEHLHEAQHAH